MIPKKRVRGNPLPLIVEEHPDSYNGYPFITLIKYREKDVLGIVDNANDKTISAYILDLCGPEQISEKKILQVASIWYENSKDRYPLSFEFSKIGLSEYVHKIYKTYAVGFVTRIIGPLPRFEMEETKSIKRRRRKTISSGIQVNNKILIL